MQHQLDYYKAQAVLLGAKPNPVKHLILPTYEDFPPSQDSMMMEGNSFANQQNDIKYSNSISFGNNVYSFDQQGQDESSESSMPPCKDFIFLFNDTSRNAD